MRQPIGLDINGWADAACRDWSAEEPDLAPADIHLLDGGLCSVVVEHDDLHVGGPQAALSPIGRGGGWGDIGAVEKRRSIAAAWRRFLTETPDPASAADLRIAAAALSHFADHRVMCIPDRPEMDEERQRVLLQAFEGPRAAGVHLLWRSVAIVLGMLDDGLLPGAANGSRVACLTHEFDGFALQLFTVRALIEHSGILAPERGGPSVVHASDWGFDTLLDRAMDAVAAANPGLADWSGERPRMPAELLFAQSWPREAEIVRRDNGTWTNVEPPASVAMPDPCALGLPRVDADILLVWTPLALCHRPALLGALHAATGLVPVVVDAGAAARGALRAARRIGRGEPHYLDRLDPIAMVVARGGEPVFEDLIGPDAIVPGNREYVSAPIEHLAWPAGMDRAEFFIRKGASQIRRWVIDSLPPPSRAEPLIVQLRQTPAQGWARLSITSGQWEELRNSPIVLDWNRLEPIASTEAEVLSTLARPRPVVPGRVRLAPHVGLWTGTARFRGLASALRHFHGEARPDFHRLSASLRTSQRDTALGQVFFAVGSDGDLPAELDPDLAGLLESAIAAAWRRLQAALDGHRLTDNGALLVLTWVFGRCPIGAKHELLRAAAALLANRSHAFLVPTRASSVVVQGLGRVLNEEALLRRAIPLVAARLDNANFVSAMAAMVSRPEAAPAVLAELDAESIMASLQHRIATCIRDGRFSIHFRHALTAIVGVLRVRERDPWALVADRSPIAAALSAELGRAAAAIDARRHRVRAADALLALLPEIAKVLDGRGGRADILDALETIDDPTDQPD